jgi:hypothetical protein
VDALDAEDMGLDHLEPDGFLQPKRYRIKLRCRRCGRRYAYITTKLDRKDPPCPKVACRVAREIEADRLQTANMLKMFDEGRSPAHIGANVGVKAVDETAKIVMEDYRLTDLKDNIRHGETMAPKLPVHQQQAADNFFNPSGAAKAAGSRRLQQRVQNLGLMAIKGALGQPAFDPGQVAQRAGIPLGSPALRMVRSEKARNA